MQVKTLWQFELQSEIDSFNVSKAARLQFNTHSLHKAKQFSLKLLPFGKNTELIFNAEKTHTIKAFDFPLRLYFDLVLEDEYTLNVHQLQDSLKQKGFFYELNSLTTEQNKVISQDDAETYVYPNNQLSYLMKGSSCTIFNSTKEEVAKIEAPYNDTFYTVLDENFAMYYISSEDSDEVLSFFYVPKAAKNTFAILALEMSSFEMPKLLSNKLLMKARKVQIRYNFVFRNSSDSMNFSFHSKSDTLSFKSVGQRELSNGKIAYCYESSDFLKVNEIEKNEPLFVMPNQKVEFDGLNNYQLPEKIYLPNIDKSSIKADERGYFIEHFITL